MIKKSIFSAVVLVSFAFTANTFASNANKGVLKSINFDDYTVSIVNTAGEVKTLKFTPETRFTHQGQSINAKRDLKPGVEVELKKTSASFTQASL